MSPSEAQPLAPGATIGILGGGQLGRMLAIAAARLGFRCHIFEPGEDPPAGHVAAQTTRASYDNRAALRQFGSTADVITYEFENVPLTALDHLAGLAPIRPGRRALEVAQDRVTEKSFLNSLAIPTAEFVAIDSRDELDTSPVAEPLILKTRRLGYDGKGQARIEQASSEARDRAWDAMAGAPAIAEQMVAFTREISVIAARSLAGQVVCFDPAENVHRDGILHTSTVTGATGQGVRTDAALIAGKILNALDYVGVMGVEMFDLGRAAPRLLVNEIAPRVHNSGHWTIEACLIDQFEQHIRAVVGWPLGDGARHSDAVMTNLIGAEADAWPTLAATGGLHLYGKAAARPGRKMGHVTRLSPRS